MCPNLNTLPQKSSQLIAAGGLITQPTKKKQRQKFITGSWNVRTLLARADTSRPERTALIARTFAAPSETRLADDCSIKEEGGGYTFFCDGKLKTKDQISGAGIAIRCAPSWDQGTPVMLY